MQAKKETVVTVEFTLMDADFVDYDLGNLTGTYHPAMKKVVSDGVRRLFPGADHIVIGVKSFLHEPEKQIRTYAQDFFEKFPKAPTEMDGTPKSCKANIYGGDKPCLVAPYDRMMICEHPELCRECWNEQMPEDEK